MIELLQRAAVTAAKLSEGRGTIMISVEVEGLLVAGEYRGTKGAQQFSLTVAWQYIGTEPDRLDEAVRMIGAKVAKAFADDTPPPRASAERARKLAQRDGGKSK